MTNAIDAQFKDFTHSPTTFYTQAEAGDPNLFAVYDAVMQQSAFGGNARPGYSQNGGDHWARGRGYSDSDRYPQWEYTKILAHYYSDTQLRDFNGALYWGAYRWNMLQLTPANETFYVNEGKAMTMRLQNTGSNPWLAGTRLYVRWRREPRNGASPTVSGWIDVAAVSALAEGADETISFTFTPPTAMFVDPTNYGYVLEWDLRMPTSAGGAMFSSNGLITQDWVIKLVKRVPKPTPKPLPNPTCYGTQPCAMTTLPQTIAWEPVDHPYAVDYRWRVDFPVSADQLGTTSSAATPPLNFDLGINTVYVRTVDPNEATNLSDEAVAATVLYDPDPPLVALDALPAWSNAQQLILHWSMSDALAGIEGVTLEQQINGGAWSLLLASASATSHATGQLIDGATYAFRLTAKDWAGNLTSTTATVTIDRIPSTSTLTAPNGALVTTWTHVAWSSNSAGAPIHSHILERLVNGVWEPLYPEAYGPSPLLFVGQPSTTYALRIRAVDLAGNIEPPTAASEITFSTGTSTAGLHQIFLPMLRYDQSAPRDGGL